MIKEKMFIIFLTLVFCLAMFSGCETGVGIAFFGNHEGLCAELERRIVMDFARNSEDPRSRFSIERFYGIYNGYVPVLIGGTRELETITTVPVAGFLFRYPTQRSIIVWKDRRFYMLADAYEQGFLTRADIRAIYDIHNSPWRW